MLDAGLWGAFALGTVLGLGTGLVPGLHPNTVAAVLAAAPIVAGPEGAVLLVATAVAHTFLNVVPALVLGVADPGVALSMLPGHRLVRSGEGEDAVVHSAAGSLVGLLAALAVVPLLGLVPSEGIGLPRPVLAGGLALLAAFLVGSERGRVPLYRTVVPVFDGVVPPGRKPVGLGRVSEPSTTVTGEARRVRGERFVVETPERVRVEDVHGWADVPDEGERVAVYGDVRRRPGPGSRAVAVGLAGVVFLAAGGLGLLAGRLAYVGVLGPSSGLFPLLTGLFGGGTLLLAHRPGRVPRQEPGAPPRTRGLVASASPGVLAGVLVAWMPTVTAAQGTALSTLAGRRDPRRVMVTLSAVNTSAAVLALGVLVAFGRVRTGVASALDGMAALPAPRVLFVSALLAGAVGYVATRTLGRRIVRRAPDLASRRVVLGVLGAVVVLVVVLSGPSGLAVFAVGAALGVVPPMVGIRRVHLMGALVVPLLAGLLGL